MNLENVNVGDRFKNEEGTHYSVYSICPDTQEIVIEQLGTCRIGTTFKDFLRFDLTKIYDAKLDWSVGDCVDTRWGNIFIRAFHSESATCSNKDDPNILLYSYDYLSRLKEAGYLKKVNHALEPIILKPEHHGRRFSAEIYGVLVVGTVEYVSSYHDGCKLLFDRDFFENENEKNLFREFVNPLHRQCYYAIYDLSKDENIKNFKILPEKQMKYKVGDRFIPNHTCAFYKSLTVASYSEDKNEYMMLIENGYAQTRYHQYTLDRYYKLEDPKMKYKVGDVLVDSSKMKAKIIHISGPIYFVSWDKKFEKVGTFYTEKQLHEYGYTLLQEPQALAFKEVTLEEIADKFGVPVEQIRVVKE